MSLTRQRVLTHVMILNCIRLVPGPNLGRGIIVTDNQIIKTDYCVETSKIKVKCSRYRPGVAQRVGRGIALIFHDRGTRRV